MEKSRIYKLIFNLFKIIVLILAYLFAYFKLKTIDFNLVFYKNSIFYLVFVVLLMLLNWSLEIKKWQLLINKFEKISFLNSAKAVLTGLTTSIFTPNRIGEFVGRILFVSKKNRINAIISTGIGSYSQIFATLFMAGVAVFLIKYGVLSIIDDNYFIKWVIVGFLIVLFLLIVFSREIINKFFKNSESVFIKKIITVFNFYSIKELLIVVLLSLLRYLVFFIQFYIFTQYFNVNISILDSFIALAIFYAFNLGIPSFFISELGIRVSSSIFIFSFFSSQISEIVLAISFLWIVNVLLPTIIGSFLFIKAKYNFWQKKRLAFANLFYINFLIILQEQLQ